MREVGDEIKEFDEELKAVEETLNQILLGYSKHSS